MIRIEAIKAFIVENSRKQKRDISVHTTNHRLLTVKDSGSNKDIDRKYDGTIYVLDAHKTMDFTAISLLLNKWLRENGNPGESFDISTDDNIDQDNVLMTIEMKIIEKISLVPIDGEEIRKKYIVPYLGIEYKMIERPQKTGA